MSTPKKKNYKKIALVLSLVAILIWSILGTGTSLAWFTDTDEAVRNIFHFADFKLEVSYRLPDGTYKEVTSSTNIFNENALYEPGYTQVVFLKIENKGSVPFNFNTAVGIADYTPSINTFDEQFKLQDYLMFGLTTASEEEDLEEMVADREKAKAFATTPLNEYSTDYAPLNAKESVFMALIVYMPESVDNNANYRDAQPSVNLALIVSATQQ